MAIKSKPPAVRVVVDSGFPVLMALFNSGCQKNVPVFKRFFLQPHMPQFRISEHYYEKRYKR